MNNNTTHQFPLDPAYRAELFGYISDDYKSLHGIRPRWKVLADMSDGDLLSELDALSSEISEEIRREKLGEEGRRLEDEAALRAEIEAKYTSQPFTMAGAFPSVAA